MLPVQSEVCLCDVIWIDHVVVYSRPGQAVGTGPVLLCPAYGAIDRDACDVNALRHQFPRHALRQP